MRGSIFEGDVSLNRATVSGGAIGR